MYEAGSHEEVGLRASVLAQELGESGFPGISLLSLSLKFENPDGGRWYIIASGDYNIPEDMPDTNYCFGPQPRRIAGGIECSSDNWASFTYNFEQELGYRGPGGAYRVYGVDGYDARHVTVISGRLPPSSARAEERSVNLWLPIPTPRPSILNGKTFLRYGQIGFSTRGSGSGELLNPECGDDDSVPMPWALAEPCTPIVDIEITRAQFYALEEVGTRAIEYSIPAVTPHPKLAWDVAGPFPGGTALLVDSFAVESAAQQTFLCGVLLGLAGSTSIAFIERTMVWVEARVSTRRSLSGSAGERHTRRSSATNS